jgi:hypothetical protein
MANFSSFFPAPSGGGGGFTNMKKYSTANALNDADYKSKVASIGWTQLTNTLIGWTTLEGYHYAGNTSPDLRVDDYFVGFTFDHQGVTHTITGDTYTGANYSVKNRHNLTFTPAIQSQHFTYNQTKTLSNTNFTITVNPATDLGLEDGSQIGYMLVGAGYAGGSVNGGYGGRIISGTATIATASTDLILTPGAANGGSSTISGGGLALSSGNGSNSSGFGDFNQSNSVVFAGGSGNMGYGAGGGNYNSGARNVGTNHHGYGVGGYTSANGGDGAILLFY